MSRPLPVSGGRASTASACVPAQPQGWASGRGRLLAAVGVAGEAAARAGGGDASLIGEAPRRGGIAFELGPWPPSQLVHSAGGGGCHDDY